MFRHFLFPFETLRGGLPERGERHDETLIVLSRRASAGQTWIMCNRINRPEVATLVSHEV